MTQLTANFSLHELTKSDTALRNDLDNTPDEEATENLRLLCEKVLQPVRDHFGKGVKVNSGFRAPAAVNIGDLWVWVNPPALDVHAANIVPQNYLPCPR